MSLATGGGVSFRPEVPSSLLETSACPPALSAQDVAQALAEARAARDRAAFDAGRHHALRAWHSPAAGADARAEAGVLLSFCLYRLGELPGLLELGTQTLALLQAPQHGPWRDDLLRWVTLGACELGRFELALACAQECCARARASDEPRRQVPALTALGACFERMGDPWQAERLMGDALAIARVHGTPFDRMQTLSNLCAVTIGAYYLLRGVAGESDVQAVLQRSLAYAREAVQIASEAADAAFDAVIWGNLGEVLVHLGQAEEAWEWLTAALLRALEGGHQAQACRIRCTVAELHLQAGRHAQAAAALGRLLQESNPGITATLVRVHHGLYRALRALGDDRGALQHFECYAQIERRRAINQLQSQSQLLVTRVEVEQARVQAERLRREALAERQRADEFESRALRDALTGLGNRRQLDRSLPGMLDQAVRGGGPMALAMLDVDHFKGVNDRFGHALGDRVLVALAQMLREHIRSEDVAVRIGGEEFLLVLPGTGAEAALEVCERLRRQVAGHDWSALAPGFSGVTVSIGLAHAPPYERQSLFEQADRALYWAKGEGRNRVKLA